VASVSRATRDKVAAVAMHGAYEAIKLLSASRPLERSLPEVLSLLRHFFDLREAAVVWDGDAGGGIATSSAGSPTSRTAALLQAALGRVMATGMPWIVESEYVDPELEAPGSGDEPSFELSFVCVPIKQSAVVRGALCIERLHSPGDQASFCFDADVRLLAVIANAIAQALPLERSRGALTTGPERSESVTTESGARIRGGLGESKAWRAARHRAVTAAKTSATVLLRGESGTGKELLARVVHDASPRHGGPFVSINCAALAEAVLASELFGHEKGAFTGALSQRKGRFELADGGSLFLDEIGEISLSFQALLLRALQLGEFERVGGMTTQRVDVRVIAATNRDLEADVRAGRFRADLYYRLSVVPILLPPLRQRPEDIPVLAAEFLRRFNADNGGELSLGPTALTALVCHPFPGNVRELENVVRRAATMAHGPVLAAEDFAWLRESTPRPTLASATHGAARSGAGDHAPTSATARAPFSTHGALVAHSDDGDGAARERLLEALERSGWVQAKAARLLGLSARQIAYALRKHKIPIQRF
jgi:Nif-specific regulatory protein